MRKKLVWSMVRIFGCIAGITIVAGYLIAQPTWRSNTGSPVHVAPEKLRTHVETLSQKYHPRNWRNIANLNLCADYIADHFTLAGAEVEHQEFKARGMMYRNVIGRFGMGKSPRYIIGAHYDSYADSPGADDNASGVAVLIELAYLIGRGILPKEIELVAYSLEEPPFFATPDMGSAVHARQLAEQQIEVAGVIVLEMVGYFSNEPGSQSFPSPLLRFFYPNRGNFITVVSRWDQGSWIKKVKTAMHGTTDLPVYSFRAPVALPGVDYSDHRSYWLYDINALMITNTAFYRNKAYHTPDDTADTLDYQRMAMVAVAVYSALYFL